MLFFKVVITGGVLYLILSHLDWQAFKAVFARIQWGPVAGCVFLLVSSQLLSAYRWKLLAEGLSLRADYFSMVRHLFSAAFFGQFLPGGVGVDAFRIWFFSRRLGKGTLLSAGYSVVAERINSIFGMALVSSVAAWLVVDVLPMAWVGGLTFFCGSALLVWFILPLLIRFIQNRWPRVTRFLSHEVLVFWHLRGPWWPTILLSMGMHLIHGTSGLMLGTAMGFTLPVAYYVFLVPTVNLVSSLPISIGGYGVREGMFILLLGYVGVEVEDALAFAILFLFSAIWVPMSGGLIYLLTRDAGESTPLQGVPSLQEELTSEDNPSPTR